MYKKNAQKRDKIHKYFIFLSKYLCVLIFFCNFASAFRAPLREGVLRVYVIYARVCIGTHLQRER